MKFSPTLLVLCTGFLISCGGGSSSGSGSVTTAEPVVSEPETTPPEKTDPETTPPETTPPETTPPQDSEDEPNPPEETQPPAPLKLEDLAEQQHIRVFSQDNKSYLSIVLKQAVQINYQLEAQDYLPRPYQDLSETTLVLQPGEHAIELPGSDVSGRRLYFNLEDSGQLTTDIFSLTMPINSSAAVSYLDRWQCSSESSNQALLVPSFLIDFQKTQDQQHSFSLVINPEWYCDAVTGNQKNNSHEYLQQLDVELLLNYSDGNSLQSARFPLSLENNNHILSFPAGVSAAEMHYSVRSRYQQVNTPTTVSATQIIQLN